MEVAGPLLPGDGAPSLGHPPGRKSGAAEALEDPNDVWLKGAWAVHIPKARLLL